MQNHSHLDRISDMISIGDPSDSVEVHVVSHQAEVSPGKFHGRQRKPLAPARVEAQAGIHGVVSVSTTHEQEVVDDGECCSDERSRL